MELDDFMGFVYNTVLSCSQINLSSSKIIKRLQSHIQKSHPWCDGLTRVKHISSSTQNVLIKKSKISLRQQKAPRCFYRIEQHNKTLSRPFEDNNSGEEAKTITVAAETMTAEHGDNSSLTSGCGNVAEKEAASGDRTAEQSSQLGKRSHDESRGSA
jgi:hypothetical protein